MDTLRALRFATASALSSLALLSATPLLAQPSSAAPDAAGAGIEAATVRAALPEAEAESLATVGAVHVSAIRVQGSTVFTPDELAALAAPYSNRTVTIEELHELRHALSSAYVDRGYVTSGVILPDQQVVDGVIVLQAVEGRLADIEIVGNRRMRERAIARRVTRYVQAPVDIDDLEVGLLSLQREPPVERVNAQLLPGATIGESHLRLAVTERPALTFEVTAANDRSPSVGENRGTVALTYGGLVGNGDALTGRFGLTRGVQDDAISYRVPLGPRDTQLDVSLSDQQADIVEEPFDAIDIKSRLKAWSLTATHPFVAEPDRSFSGILGFEHKRSESTLLGMPFSFSPGDVGGKARGSAVSVGAEVTRRRDSTAWAARAVVQLGVDALDATINAAGPDSEFATLLVQAQFARAIAWRRSRLLVRGVVQRAGEPLLAMYKMPLGGRYSVRGYRENQFVRDNGVAASIEYQFPLIVDETGRARDELKLAVFSDYGVSWDEDASLPTSRKARIASAGLGLLWAPTPGFHADVYWGAAFDEQPHPTTTAQDRGFHYQLGFNRSF